MKCLKEIRKMAVAALLILCMLGAMALPAFASGGVQHYSGNYWGGGRWEFDFDYTWMVTGNNRTYLSNLGELSVVLAQNAEQMLKKDGQPVDCVKFLSDLGMSDPVRVVLTADEYEYDKNDLTEVNFAHVPLTVDGTDYELIFVAVQGTIYSHEWVSNLDMGADTEEYYRATGEHPDWLRKENHKGFDVAATRVDQRLGSYERAYVDQNAQKIILFCGHSRGGAIANILGKIYEDKSDYKSFTYTAAAPNTTEAGDGNAEDTTIFNIVNADDVVSVIPLNEWGFYRYGKDIRESIIEVYADEFHARSGVDYTSANAQGVIESLAKTVDSRGELYTIGNSNVHMAALGRAFALQKNAWERVEEMRAYLAPDGADHLVEFRVSAANVPEYYVSPAYVFYVVGKIFSCIDMTAMLSGAEISADMMKGPMQVLTTHPLPAAYYTAVLSIVQNLNMKGFGSSHSGLAGELIAETGIGFDDADFFPDGSGSEYTASVFSGGSVALIAGLVVVAAAGLGVMVWKKKAPKKEA